MSILNEDKQYHLKISKDDVGQYVILPGDPGRVPLIAQLLDNAKFVAQNREYTTYTGSLNNVKVSVVSTGIGGPSAAIAIEELIKCGCHTFIRVGSCGGIMKDVIGGDIVIATASVRAEGTSIEYLPDGYPAAANFEVVTATVAAAKELSSDSDGNRYHVGVVQSKDSFYGETNPETMPVFDMLKNKWDAYVQCGCLASEMESAALFSVGLARGVRVGALFTTYWNIEREKLGLSNPVCNDNSRTIKCAVEAIRKLL